MQSLHVFGNTRQVRLATVHTLVCLSHLVPQFVIQRLAHRDRLRIDRQALSELQDEVETSQNDKESLEERVGDLEDEVQDLKGEVEELEGRTEELEGQVEELESKVVDLEADLQKRVRVLERCFRAGNENE